MLLLLIIIVLVVLYKKQQDRNLLLTVTTVDSGTSSERNLVIRLLKLNVPAITIFHDLYVPKYNEQYSQIDVVLLTRVGVIVFEVKDYSGWLFGNGHQEQWTQVLSYGKEKYRFYNPIKQNATHIASLKNGLKQCADVPFFSVIVFYGDCVLKNISNIPPDTYIISPSNLGKVITTITNNNPTAHYADKLGTIAILKSYVYNGHNEAIRLRHIRNIHNMYQ